MIHKTAALLGASLLALASPALAEAHDHENGIELLRDSTDTAAAAPALPTIDFGTWGFQPSGIATDIKPGDDFDAYANKRWVDANPLPAEFSRIGAFTLLDEKSTADVKALMDELAARDAASLSGDEKRILDAYRTYLDTGAIEAAGLAPAQPYLAKIAAARSLDDLARLWAEPGIASPISAGVTIDPKQPDRHIAAVGFGGLGMPDRDYYLDESEKGRDIQAKYKQYLAFLLGEAGYADPAAMAEQVYAFE
ncbi:MAG: M13 family metallopeptidase, partial [Beijerinckiaceae bacterium]|nr:M13 family metallopeptidase [Beijerinckiaceae bacterium]